MFQFRPGLVSSFKSKLVGRKPLAVGGGAARLAAVSAVSMNGPASHRMPEMPRELPDVTGFLVVVVVTLGLFVVPVGATIMQGPAIVAGILGR